MRKQVVSMKRGYLIFGVIMVMLLPSFALADEYWGWDEIRPALIDGDGAKFVVETTYEGVVLDGDLEFDKVLSAANWVAYHMSYVPDPDPPGDVWTDSDQQFEEIAQGTPGSGTGDCEDFAILLCALARFVVGVPADRIWVQAGLVSVPDATPAEGEPPLAGHAYVVYKAQRWGIFYIEPQWGGFPYRGSPPSILHWDYRRPPMAGESATLRFNDQWVKGGGFWLAGRRAPSRDNSPATTWGKIKSR